MARPVASWSRCRRLPPGSGFPARVEYDVPDPCLRPVQGDIRPPEVWNALTGMEMMRGFLDGEFGQGPISLLFGMRPTDADDGQVTAEMAATEWHCGMGGTVYGGLLALFAQSCMESAILTTLPAGTLHATLDLTVHFIRPILPGEGTVKVEASVDHRGRLVRVASARILDAEGRTAAPGQVVGHGGAGRNPPPAPRRVPPGRDVLPVDGPPKPLTRH